MCLPLYLSEGHWHQLAADTSVLEINEIIRNDLSLSGLSFFLLLYKTKKSDSHLNKLTMCAAALMHRVICKVTKVIKGAMCKNW